MNAPTSMLLNRYPGSKPFTLEYEGLFFGRDEDIAALAKFVHVEKLSVLYGKSGLGKSSLIGAGVVPRLEQQYQYKTIPIRFNSYVEGNSSFPIDIFLDTLYDPQHEPNNELAAIESENVSLWQYFKNLQLTHPDQQATLLVFDQFEELFTYPKEQIEHFARILASLLNDNMPRTFKRKLREQSAKNPDVLTTAQWDMIDKPSNIKVLLAIRSDKMSLLDRLSPFIPSILRNCYELKSLSREQARHAIVEPAAAKGEFRSPIFSYQAEALETILNYLDKEGEKEIESFQLQILCQYVEESIVIGRNDNYVEVPDLGKLEDVYQGYYDHHIQGVGSEADIQAARKLIEEGLIFEEEERRISLYEGQIVAPPFEVGPELLARIEQTRLIRPFPNPGGGYSYEISHDTLVAPILKSKARRIEAEERERLRLEAIATENAKLEAERQQRAKLRRRAILYGGIGLLIILALIIFNSFLNREKNNALAEKARADLLRAVSDSLLARSDSLLKLANQEKIRAQDANVSALLALDQAREARELADFQANQAEIAKADALKQAEVARAALIQTINSSLPVAQDANIQNPDSSYVTGLGSESNMQSQELVFEQWIRSDNPDELRKGMLFFNERANAFRNLKEHMYGIPDDKLSKFFGQQRRFYEQAIAFNQKYNDLARKDGHYLDPTPIYLDQVYSLIWFREHAHAAELAQKYLKEVQSPQINRLYPNLLVCLNQLDSIALVRQIFNEWAAKSYPIKTWTNYAEAFWANVNYWADIEKYEGVWLSARLYRLKSLYTDVWAHLGAQGKIDEPWQFFANNKYYDHEDYGLQAFRTHYRLTGSPPTDYQAYSRELSYWYLRGSYEFNQYEQDSAISLLKEGISLAEKGSKGKDRLVKHLMKKYIENKHYREAFELFRSADDYDDFMRALIYQYIAEASKNFRSRHPEVAVEIMENAWKIIPDQLAIKGRLLPTLVCAYLLNGHVGKPVDLMNQYRDQWYPVDKLSGDYNEYSPHSYWGNIHKTIKYWRNNGDWVKGLYDFNLEKGENYLKDSWIDITNADILEEGGDVYTQSGYKLTPNFPLGLKLYLKAAELKEEASELTERKIPLTYLAITSRLMKKQAFDQVIPIAEEALSKMDKGIPQNARLIPTLVNAYLLTDRWEDAKKLIKKHLFTQYPVANKYFRFKEAFIGTMDYWEEAGILTRSQDNPFDRAREFIGEESDGY